MQVGLYLDQAWISPIRLVGPNKARIKDGKRVGLMYIRGNGFCLGLGNISQQVD